VENIITHAEIKHTTFLKMTPTGSKIKGRVKEVLLIDKISHSTSIVELENTK
jgi:hypothetical protein